MNGFIEKFRDKGLDKIVFLLSFALCLLMAKLLILERSRLDFGKLYSLKGTELEVALPVSGNWESIPNWKYNGREYILYGAKKDINGNLLDLFAYVYHLNMAETNIEKMLDMQLAGDSLIDGGVTPAKGTTIYWRLVKQSEERVTGSRSGGGNYKLLAGADLGSGRFLRMEIESVEGEDVIMEIFNGAVKHLRFSDNELLRTGAQMVNDLKTGGIDVGIVRPKQNNIYKISNSFDRVIGFKSEMLGTDYFEDGQVGKKISSFDFIQSGKAEFTKKEDLIFKPGLEKFFIKSKYASNLNERYKFYEIHFENEQVEVVDFDSTLKVRYKPGPAAISEQFYLEIVNAFVRSEYKEVLVDMINYQGDIVPTILSHHINGLESVGVHAVKFQSLDENKDIEIIYVGDMGELIKVENKNMGLVVEPGKRDELAEAFPMWGQWIRSSGSSN
jgi:hypothetical protein